MNLENINETIFESIKHVDEEGREYWLARELQKILEYSQWRRFENVINKAKESCINSNNNVSDYFANVGKIVNTGISTKKIIDYKLSRYACYLIAMNGDSRKEVIALAQTDSKLKKDNIKGEKEANKVHYNMGKDIREFIRKQGGIMPEDLPTPKQSLKEIDKK